MFFELRSIYKNLSRRNSVKNNQDIENSTTFNIKYFWKNINLNISNIGLLNVMNFNAKLVLMDLIL